MGHTAFLNGEWRRLLLYKLILTPEGLLQLLRTVDVSIISANVASAALAKVLGGLLFSLRSEFTYIFDLKSCAFILVDQVDTFQDRGLSGQPNRGPV
jgi:hypothetical protein